MVAVIGSGGASASNCPASEASQTWPPSRSRAPASRAGRVSTASLTFWPTTASTARLICFERRRRPARRRFPRPRRRWRSSRFAPARARSSGSVVNESTSRRASCCCRRGSGGLAQQALGQLGRRGDHFVRNDRRASSRCRSMAGAGLFLAALDDLFGLGDQPLALGLGLLARLLQRPPGAAAPCRPTALELFLQRQRPRARAFSASACAWAMAARRSSMASRSGRYSRRCRT